MREQEPANYPPGPGMSQAADSFDARHATRASKAEAVLQSAMMLRHDPRRRESGPRDDVASSFDCKLQEVGRNRYVAPPPPPPTGDAALRELRWDAQQLRRQMVAAAAKEELEDAARLKSGLQAALAALDAAERQRAEDEERSWQRHRARPPPAAAPPPAAVSGWQLADSIWAPRALCGDSKGL